VNGFASRAASWKPIGPGKLHRLRVIAEDRLLGGLGRFEENQRVDVVANEAYDRWRATARDTKGRVLKGNSKPFTPPTMPDGVINLSDSDSWVMRTQGTPPRQAYNAQAAVNDQQVILAAEISIAAPDFGHLAPMLNTTLAGLHQRGITEVPEVVLADAGYWHTAQMQAITERGIEVLIPPDGNMRQGKRPGWDDRLYQQMRDTPRCLRPRFSACRPASNASVTNGIKTLLRSGTGSASAAISARCSTARLPAATHRCSQRTRSACCEGRS
jgi:hypothetical protein